MTTFGFTVVRESDGAEIGAARSPGYCSAFLKVMGYRTEDCGTRWIWEGFGEPGCHLYSAEGNERFRVVLQPGSER